MKTFAMAVLLASGPVAGLAAQTKNPPPKIITEVSAAVDLPNYQGGPCPAKLTFT